MTEQIEGIQDWILLKSGRSLQCTGCASSKLTMNNSEPQCPTHKASLRQGPGAHGQGRTMTCEPWKVKLFSVCQAQLPLQGMQDL